MLTANAPGKPEPRQIEPVPFGFSADQCDARCNANLISWCIAKYLGGAHDSGGALHFTRDVPDGLLPAQGVSETVFSDALRRFVCNNIENHAKTQLPQWYGQLLDGAKAIEDIHKKIWHSHATNARQEAPHPREVSFNTEYAPWNYSFAEMRQMIFCFYWNLQASAPDLHRATRYNCPGGNALGSIIMRDFSVAIAKPGYPEQSEYRSPAMTFYPERIVIADIKDAHHYDQIPKPKAHYLPTHVLLCMSALLVHFVSWHGSHQGRKR